MADTTPEPTASEPTGDTPQKPAARKKSASRTPAAGSAGASTTPSGTAGPANSEPEVVATPDPEPAPASAGDKVVKPRGAASSGGGRSVLDGVRDNSMGPLVAGLVVAIAVGLLLSVLVPNDPSVLALGILGALLSAAVGLTVRLLSTERGLRRQVETFVAAVIGVHLMSVTGAVGGEIPILEQLGAEGPGFNEALLVALATPAFSTGAALSGLTAAIIVGWGRAAARTSRDHAAH